MLRSRFIKLFTFTLADERYLLAAKDDHTRFLPVSEWKDIVFSSHTESFYGTMLPEGTVEVEATDVFGSASRDSRTAEAGLEARERGAHDADLEARERGTAEAELAARNADAANPGAARRDGGDGEPASDNATITVEGVVVTGWELVSLFGNESFNHFIEWDWSEPAEICLAASHSLLEGIIEKDWHPDFSAWEHGNFSWRLPERVINEFDPSFWEQSLHGDGSRVSANDESRGTVGAAADGNDSRDSGEPPVGVPSGHHGASETVKEFISNLYNAALDTYLTRNPAMKELFGPKLDLLKKHNISGNMLARYFDEESWLEWVGIKEDNAPFTIGIRLDEPIDGEGEWTLDIFLREKKNIDNLYTLSKAPTRWRSFFDKVSREVGRWLKLIPWLGGSEENGTMWLKSELSEEEAWLFLTDASEMLVALGVEILLPSWWQAMKSANLRVKASLKSTASHRPSFVGLSAMLDFNWRFSMNGVDLSEDEFNNLVEEKRRLVYIRGRWVKLDPQFIRQIQDLMKKAEKEGLHVRDLLEQELMHDDTATEEELENPKAFARIQIELNRHWKQMVKQLSELKEIPEVTVPAGLNGTLRPYQQLGMSWLWFLRQYNFGACLADDMGLGKTIQLISYLLEVKERETPEGMEQKGLTAAKTGKTLAAAAIEVAEEMGTAAAGNEAAENGTDANAAGTLPVKAGDDTQAVAFGTRAVNNSTETAMHIAVNPLEKSSKRHKQTADELSKKEPVSTALIICPTSVLGNWQKELERFAPSLNVYLHYGSNRLKGASFSEKIKDVDVVLTSYGLAHIDSEEFERFFWSSIAIDEAQNIKNPQTKQSRAVRRLRGRHHIALTGTPMENRLSELWSIFDFTNHGYLGSIGQFQKKFVIPIEKDENKDKVRTLQALIRPFLLRRTKKDEEVALNLPDKQEQKEYCPLTAEQASLYEQLVKDTFAEIEKLSGFERKGLILQMLSRLKQLCNHPALYLKEKAMSHLLERSAKMEKLAELVEAVLEQKESCLIFTQYIDMGEMIRALLKKKFGIKVPFLNGSVPKAQRDSMIEQFQNHEFPVFLLSLKAGGTGLNLTAANHVIHYDRWWNPAVENQATDRAYRIGQHRFVHVHKLISTGTLEEKIDAMLEKKQFLNDQIIQSEHWITELSTDDLRDLVLLG